MTDFNQMVGQILDPYARQARLAPALIVLLPAILLIMGWFPASWTMWGAIISVAASCGFIFFLAQIARDRGKRLEPRLFAQWGGKPSVALMRHRDDRIDANTKARYRNYLASQLKDLVFPTAEEERADQGHADAVYESVTAWLLTRTRDPKQFALLFRENISYGFRRNLWGLKPVGFLIALASAAASTGAIIYFYFRESATPSVQITGLTALAWLLAVIWVTVVTPSWVRTTADAYAIQLLAACDTLSQPKAARRGATKA